MFGDISLGFTWVVNCSLLNHLSLNPLKNECENEWYVCRQC